MASAPNALARLLRSPDPTAALEDLRRGGDLDPALDSALAHIDSDGLRIAALLVAKLRFERLMQGSAEARRWFGGDPAGFSAAFRRYHAACPARSPFAATEAADWAAWRRGDRQG